jgi:tetratricopeptide (TPR) repeat protein
VFVKKIQKLLCGWLLVLAVLFMPASAAQTNVVVFPLENKTGDSSLQWLGAVLPGSFYRLVSTVDGYQAWDPVFMFSADSSAWRLDSSASIARHCRRWNWNYAVGGSYSISGTTIKVILKVAVPVNDSAAIKEAVVLGSLNDVPALYGSMFRQSIQLMGGSVSPSAAGKLSKSIAASGDAYATYAAGYLFEMHGDYAAALTAYIRANEIDPSCMYSLFRAGKLYAAAKIFDKSNDCFSRCSGSDDPMIVSGIAEYYAAHEPSEKALSYIKAHYNVLGASPAGIKAMAQSFVLSGNYQHAAELLQQAVADGVPDLEAEEMLGQTYLLCGAFSKAADIFGQLIMHRPAYVPYYLLQGTAYRSGGNLMESVRVLNAAKTLEPDNTAVLINIAQTYLKLGWYDDALHVLNLAREDAPTVAAVYLNTGIVYWYMNKHTEAQQMLEKAQSLGVSQQVLYNSKGNMLFLSGSIKDAIDMYLMAEKAGLKNTVVYTNLAVSYLALHDTKNALRYFDKVLSIAPDRPDILIQQAEIAEQQGKTKVAEESYRHILGQTPDDENVCVHLAGLLIKQKRYKDALDPVEAFLKASPTSTKAQMLRAQLYEKMGWYDVAVMYYTTLLSDNPDSREANLGLGRSIYYSPKTKKDIQYDNAIYYLKKASSLDSNDPEPDFIIGNIYMDKKKYRELALTHWKKSLSIAVEPAMIKALKKCIAKAEK